MEEICLHCADKGFEDAFVYCVKCLEVAVHRYCLYEIPNIPTTPDEVVYWVCEDCEEKLEKDSLILKNNAIPCETSYSEGFGVENNKDNDVIVRTEDQIYEGGLQQSYNYCSRSPPHESDAQPHTTEPCVDSYNDSQGSSKKRKTVSCSEANIEDQTKGSVSTEPFSGNEAIDSENCCLDDASTVGRIVGSRTDHNDNKELVVSESSAKPLQAISLWNYSMNELNTSSIYESPPCPEPVIMPIWRGSFNMHNQNNEILSGLNAHISNKAYHKVYEEACQFQPVLNLEMLPKSDVWPKSFEISEPTSDNIALYFFPSEISAWDFDQLLDKMAREKLALRSFVQDAELLIFPSDLLPLQDCKIQDKLYLWGVFRGKPAPSPSPSSSRLCTMEYGDKLLKHEDIPNGHMVEEDLTNMDSPVSHSPNNYVILKDDASPCETRDIRMKDQIFDAPLQQSYDACPQPPCISDVQPCTAEARVVLVKEKEVEVIRTENHVYEREGGLQQSNDVLNNESNRSSKRMKTVEKQIQETSSSVRPFSEVEAIDLRNQLAITRTKGMGIGPSNAYNENKELVVKRESFITPHQTSNPRNNFLNNSITSTSSYTFPEPITRPIQRGSVNIWKETNNMVHGSTAHISNSNCQRVYEGAFQSLHQFQQPPFHQFQQPPFHQFQQPPFHQFQQPPFHHFRQLPFHHVHPSPPDTNRLPKYDHPNIPEPKVSISENKMKKKRKKMKMSSANAEFESEPKKAKEELKSGNKKKKRKEPKGICFYCGVDGHWKRNCTKYLSDLKDK